jgi:hypothetical protein
MDKALRESALNHYDKMIAWASQQPEDEDASMDKMHNAIKENWSSSHCVYCEFYSFCDTCPLSAKEINKGYGFRYKSEQNIYYFNNYSCCNGLWIMMSSSTTWGDWVINANKVYDYIQKKG